MNGGWKWFDRAVQRIIIRSCLFSQSSHNLLVLHPIPILVGSRKERDIYSVQSEDMKNCVTCRQLVAFPTPRSHREEITSWWVILNWPRQESLPIRANECSIIFALHQRVKGRRDLWPSTLLLENKIQKSVHSVRVYIYGEGAFYKHTLTQYGSGACAK